MKIENSLNQNLGKTSDNRTQKTSSQPKVDHATKSATIPKSQPIEEPAYVVAFSTREKTDEEKAASKGYSPQEVQAKAKAFLDSPMFPEEHKAILKEILESKS